MRASTRPDGRINEILAQLQRFSGREFDVSLSVSNNGDETDTIIEELESLRQALRISYEATRSKEERTNRLLDILLRYTTLDFSEKAIIGPAGDEIDAIAAGLNAMAEEVAYHHRCLKESEEHIRLLNSSLEQRVVERTEELRESERKYRNLFENNPMALWVLDSATLQFIDVNESALRQYGYSREEFLSMSAVDIRSEEDKSRFVELSRESEGTQNAGIWKHLTKGNDLLHVDVTVHNISFDGKPARLVLAQDVTERERMQKAILELNQELEQRVTQRTLELQLVNKELEAFSYSVSHDLRAPLRAIHSYSQILVEDYEAILGSEGQRVLGMVKSNAKRMGQLIDDLLSFSRMGKKELNITDVDIDQIVHEVLRESAHTRDDRTNITVHPMLRTRADSALLRQVFQNLISNALKYSSKKQSPTVEIGLKEVKGQPTYFVKDNGAGFDMTYYNKLFGVFQRLHGQDEFEGTGVGLALVQRIITRHGGKVWADSIVGEGATFYFTIKHYS